MSHSSSTSPLKAQCIDTLLWLVLWPAHTASGSRSLSDGPARRSPPAAGWKACLCGARWWSRRTRRRRPRSTSAPASCGTWRPCRAARGTLGPQTAAAAWRWARWSSPWRRRRRVTPDDINIPQILDNDITAVCRAQWSWHTMAAETWGDEWRARVQLSCQPLLLLAVLKVSFENNLHLFCKPIFAAERSRDRAGHAELLLLLLDVVACGRMLTQLHCKTTYDDNMT